MPELRPEWVCSECGVHCYRATGEPFSSPEGWDRAANRCLACAKQDESQESTEDRARRLVLDGKKTNEIARACKGVTKKWVNDLRKELIEAGDLDPEAMASKPKPDRDPDRIKENDRPKVPGVEAALKDDPARTNQAVGDELGVRTQTVAATRRLLGLPDAITAAKQKRGEEIRQALRDHPDLSDTEIGRRLGLAKNTIGAVRRKLGASAKR